MDMLRSWHFQPINWCLSSKNVSCISFWIFIRTRWYLAFMRDEVPEDDNWRVQEVLAKAFDEFCRKTGYEKVLPIIDEWLDNHNPNTRRAVTEGLRIWTSRPYFKDNPNEAIRWIAALKEDTSEYVRKSVGNALRDISKKFPELIRAELNNWKLDSKEINQVYKLASKFIIWQI